MYTLDDIDDYQNRLTDEQKSIVIKHCNKQELKPVICAWYDDMDEFYSDWCGELGYSKEDANELFDGVRDNYGEFIQFTDESIIRFEY